MIITLLFCSELAAQAQTEHRYKDLVFPNVTIDKDQSYKPEAPKDERKSYLFDLYTPAGDKASKRPLIIWMHGGGFKFGSKGAKGVQIWSKTFAQRGMFVPISIIASAKKTRCYISIYYYKAAIMRHRMQRQR